MLQDWPAELLLETAAQLSELDDVARLCFTCSRLYNVLICPLYERRARSSMYDPAQLAVCRNNEPVLRRLLRRQPRIVETDKSPYDAALATAMEQGLQEMLRVVIDEDARLQVGTSLYAAAYYGHKGDLQTIIQGQGSYLNATGGICGGPLQAASYRGHEGAVRALLNAGADIEYAPKGFGSPLFAAALGGHLEIAKALLAAGASLSGYGRVYGGPWQAAACCGHERIIQLFIDQHETPDKKSQREALREAALAGHRHVVRQLIDYGVNVNASGGELNNALKAACCKGHEDVARLLLDHGADPYGGRPREGPLQVAAYGGYYNIVQLLLDHSVDVNKPDGTRTPLHAAARGGHESIVKLLLDRGASPNNASDDGWPLRDASRRGHAGVVRLLLDLGAHHSASRPSGISGIQTSALEFAAEGGHLSIAVMLLQAGANVHGGCGTYETAIKAASAKGHAKLVQLLIDWGALIEMHNYQTGMSLGGGYFGGPLQVASYYGHGEVAKVLIEAGADVGALDGRALRSAVDRGHEEVAGILRDAM